MRECCVFPSIKRFQVSRIMLFKTLCKSPCNFSLPYVLQNRRLRLQNKMYCNAFSCHNAEANRSPKFFKRLLVSYFMNRFRCLPIVNMQRYWLPIVGSVFVAVRQPTWFPWLFGHDEMSGQIQSLSQSREWSQS